MKRLLRFSLRSLLVVTTACAMLAGYWVRRIRAEQVAIRVVEEAGGWVSFDFQYFKNGNYNRNGKSPSPEWLVGALEVDPFARITNASGPMNKFSDKELAVLSRLKELRHVSNNHLLCGSTVITLSPSDDFIVFDPCTNDRAIDSAAQTLITDTSLKSLSVCPALESITLMSQSMTNEGVAHLVRSRNLEYLYLGSRQINDQSIVHFSKMTNLKRLNVSATRITHDGVKRLKDALPDCEVFDRRVFEN